MNCFGQFVNSKSAAFVNVLRAPWQRVTASHGGRGSAEEQTSFSNHNEGERLGLN
jgi:hypothetical protein